MVLERANNAADSMTPVNSYADLLQRDIFGPMGLNGSHFLTTEENKHLVVVPSRGPEVAVRIMALDFTSLRLILTRRTKISLTL